MLLNEHKVNIKLVADNSSLSKHFSDYPDIPVIVPGDMQNIPAGAIHFHPEKGIQNVLEALKAKSDNLVIVNHSLSHADTMGQTSDASDMLIGGANSAEAFAGGIPFITIAISGWREYKLIEMQKTDILNASKNIGLDITGIGTGGIAGAKVGAIIGTTLGPAGTLIGGIIGGIGGAFGGRFLTDKVKYINYNNARESYHEKQKLLESTIRDSEKNAQVKWEAYYFEQQEILKTNKMNTENIVKQSIDEVRKWRVDSEKIETNEALEYLNECKNQIKTILYQINQERSSLNMFSRIYLIHELWTLNYAKIELEKMKNQILEIETDIFQLDWVDRSTFLNKIGRIGLIKDKIVFDLKLFENKRLTKEKNMRSLIEDSQSKLVNCRVVTSNMLNSYINKLTGEIKETTEKAVNDVKFAGEKLQAEANKLGK